LGVDTRNKLVVYFEIISVCFLKDESDNAAGINFGLVLGLYKNSYVRNLIYLI